MKAIPPYHQLLLLLLLPFSLLAQTEEKALARVNENIYLLKSGKFQSLHDRMDETMKRIADPSKLEGLWDGLIFQFGELKTLGDTKVKKQDSLWFGYNSLGFEKGSIKLKMVLDESLLISGLFIEPIEVPYSPPGWIHMRSIYESKKPVPLNDFPSEGMAAFPNTNTRVPLVIIVGGSGPNDKDLTLGSNKIYKDLALGLAHYGIASYRYDKRTKAFGNKMGDPSKLTVTQEYLLDLQAIVAMFRKDERIDTQRIYLFGHSEGGYLCPWFMTEIQGLAGFITFGANYQNLMETLKPQLTYLIENTNSDEGKKVYQEELSKIPYALNKLKVDSPRDSIPLGIWPTYLIHLNKVAPKNYLTQIKQKRILILQGKRDYQVQEQEFDLWKAALKSHSDAQFTIYQELNHVMLRGEGKSLPNEYLEQGNVSFTLTKDIANWVKLK